MAFHLVPANSAAIVHIVGDEMGDGMAASKSLTARQPKKALSAAFVRTVTDPGKYFDGHGLFLRVEPNGAKRWVQRIVIRGKRREIGLGSAALVSLAEARQEALDNRRVARSGGDPLAAKREAAAVLTFAEAARKVHDLHRPTWRNEKHGQQFINTLETYAFPHFGKMRVSDVTTADVLAALTPIWTEKPETARRVRQRIGTVMKWAVAQGWRQDNPAEAISKALPKHDASRVKNRKALHYSEVARGDPGRPGKRRRVVNEAGLRVSCPDGGALRRGPQRDLGRNRHGEGRMANPRRAHEGEAPAPGSAVGPGNGNASEC